MTPTATYIAEENCLQELPQMEKPRSANEYESATVRNLLARERETYNAHLATLRRIQCDETCTGKWKDNDQLTEGKHYKIEKVCRTYYESCEIGSTCGKCLLVAFPLVPVKSEDELWEEVEKLRAENVKMRRALEVHDEYAILLTDEINEILVYVPHGWKSTRYEKGKELRDKLEALK